MAKGMYQAIRERWKKPKENPNYRNLLIRLRKQNVVKRVDKPTRLDRARSVGYRAKPGVIVAQTRVKKGGRKRPRWKGGRKPSKMGQRRYYPSKSSRVRAEERSNRKFKNCEVLNSYLLAEDGKYRWFEVILLDKEHPQIKADEKYSKIINQKGRAYRGKTSAGRKSRGQGRGRKFKGNNH